MTSLIHNGVSLPPVLPELRTLLDHYLLDAESLPIHNAKFSKKFWPVYPEPQRLFNPTLNPLNSTLEVERDPATGVITGVKENLNSGQGCTAKNSFSLRRVPGPPEEAVRGSSTNYPFWPGGIPEPNIVKAHFDEERLFNPENYVTRHPKLSRGLEFEKKEILTENNEHEDSHQSDIVDLAEMLKVNNKDFNIFEIKEEKKAKKNLSLQDLEFDDSTVITDLKSSQPVLFFDEDVIKISEGTGKELVAKSTEWAIVVDVNSPVDDFHERVPNPACKYDFELDIFQKQAILHLEKHESVFVAAHTSAGKTVVAEYSIALALKHMTKAIYTSPIKALSNQKYRDFKINFEDVGLLTGDIQINSKASCLIMTTEILQSMLYNGSELIKDLETVIFDEVHYINNAERGHVWEEVIIMLPDHINIVLLSATVPNTVEFADWIGRIKKKKLYVISTTKRPVPLEHFLYTGSGGKSKDERFMIVDANGNFLMKGYNEALAAKEEREKKSHKLQGPKKRQMFGKQEANMWIGLIDHLNKNDLTPVVAFTLSKKRCDQNAYQLLSQDLTTQREKGEIHSFIKRCTDHFQGSDKNLPQVIHMQELLKKGIGVHHSGILPILKEVVEMLFAKGLVKLLFATETFAMGVNMPARAVVFDSITKHDGTKFRDLVPSEYIQMAGRAGRRGLDTTGTVIILCKGEVPDMNDLKNMMLGKPTKLESQFKLTYSMILNLLSVEHLRVEDMMKRSFSESLQLRNQSSYENDLKSSEDKLKQRSELECIMCEGIQNFYANTRDYLEARHKHLKIIFSHPKAMKMLENGRIIKVCHKSYQNFVACLIKDPNDKRSDEKYCVLVLSDKNLNDEKMTTETLRMKEFLAAVDDSFHVIEKTSEHKLLDISLCSIVGISNKILKIEKVKAIIENIKKREIPRFRNDPPGESVMQVVKELQRINESAGQNLTFENYSEFGIKELDIVEKLSELEALREKCKRHRCIECPQFAEHFAQAYERLKVQEDIAHLKFLMSEEALQLHPEYQSRIKVLEQLGYIEDNKTITIKGRVACIMGNHELMVTELLLENVFANKSVHEIAALLSSLVFQQKNCSKPSLTEDLSKGIKQFKEVATKIGEAQVKCGLIEPVGDFVDQFNFGLCEVVYQWSLGMSFEKIMELTDVQEGIVVKCIQRLDESLRDVRNAAGMIGDTNLFEKMEQASTAIKRDIVFAASLYTQ